MLTVGVNCPVDGVILSGPADGNGANPGGKCLVTVTTFPFESSALN